MTCPLPPLECPPTLSQSSGDTNGNSSGSALTLPVRLHTSLSPRASPDASLWAPQTVALQWPQGDSCLNNPGQASSATHAIPQLLLANPWPVLSPHLTWQLLVARDTTRTSALAESSHPDVHSLPSAAPNWWENTLQTGQLWPALSPQNTCSGSPRAHSFPSLHLLVPAGPRELSG